MSQRTGAKNGLSVWAAVVHICGLNQHVSHVEQLCLVVKRVLQNLPRGFNEKDMNHNDLNYLLNCPVDQAALDQSCGWKITGKV